MVYDRANSSAVSRGASWRSRTPEYTAATRAAAADALTVDVRELRSIAESLDLAHDTTYRQELDVDTAIKHLAREVGDGAQRELTGAGELRELPPERRGRATA